MPNSQFNDQATMNREGIVHVTGTVTGVDPGADIEFRFMLVQNEVVAKGTGQLASANGWNGDTGPGQGPLDAGSALAIGLALLTRSDPDGGLGYETFTWSDQIDIQ